MDLRAVRESAKPKLKGACRVCLVCDGRACAGEVPGMGGTGTGEAFKANVRALATINLNLRTIHNASSPDTTANFLKQQLKTPIMAAPMTNSVLNAGGGLTEREMVTSIVMGSHLAGSMAWLGDPADAAMYAAGLDAMNSAGRGAVIIKPRVDHDNVLHLFSQVEKAGAVAVGIDVDGAGLITMKLKGQPVGPKTKAQITELVQSTNLPFIVKGIMTVDEAIICAEAGVNAIVVSNHGGRVLDHTPGTADVLHPIAKAVRGKVTIFVDGGIRSGVDALKMLALGADGVLVGRPLIVGAYGGGADGVKFLVEKYTSELYAGMLLTGCSSLAEITPRILSLW